jgi:hypothetical protein
LTSPKLHSVAWLRAYMPPAVTDKVYQPRPARQLELPVKPKLAYTSTSI